MSIERKILIRCFSFETNRSTCKKHDSCKSVENRNLFLKLRSAENNRFQEFEYS